MLPSLPPAGLIIAGLSEQSAPRLPLVSLGTLRELERQLDDDTGQCVVFVRNFIGMWDGRYARLAIAVGAWNEPDTMDAVLSLKCSSRMVGAERLGRLVEELEQEVRQRHRGSAATLLESVRSCGKQTMTHLQQGYLRECA